MRKGPIRERKHEGWPLNIPIGHTCGDCKEFSSCQHDTYVMAIAGDKVCAICPSGFALPGQQSEADKLIERERARDAQINLERSMAA